MRFGDALLLLLLALIGFGFLLSHSLNLNQELTEARYQLAQTQSELRAVEAQVQALMEEKNRLTAQVAGLAGDNTALQARLDTLESDRLILRAQIETLQAQVAFVESTSPLLGWLAASPGGRVAILLLVPALPLSFGLAYRLAHRQATQPNTVPPAAHSTFQATLTREELHQLAQLRRARTTRNPPPH